MKIKELFITERRYNDAYTLRGWWWTLLALLVVWAASAGIYSFGVAQSRAQCRAYSEETLKDTKSVKVSFMNWQCFVRVDGHWVLREQVRIIEQGD